MPNSLAGIFDIFVSKLITIRILLAFLFVWNNSNEHSENNYFHLTIFPVLNGSHRLTKKKTKHTHLMQRLSKIMSRFSCGRVHLYVCICVSVKTTLVPYDQQHRLRISSSTLAIDKYHYIVKEKSAGRLIIHTQNMSLSQIPWQELWNHKKNSFIDNVNGFFLLFLLLLVGSLTSETIRRKKKKLHLFAINLFCIGKLCVHAIKKTIPKDSFCQKIKNETKRVKPVSHREETFSVYGHRTTNTIVYVYFWIVYEREREWIVQIFHELVVYFERKFFN